MLSRIVQILEYMDAKVNPDVMVFYTTSFLSLAFFVYVYWDSVLMSAL